MDIPKPLDLFKLVPSVSAQTYWHKRLVCPQLKGLLVHIFFNVEQIWNFMTLVVFLKLQMPQCWPIQGVVKMIFHQHNSTRNPPSSKQHCFLSSLDLLRPKISPPKYTLKPRLTFFLTVSHSNEKYFAAIISRISANRILNRNHIRARLSNAGNHEGSFTRGKHDINIRSGFSKWGQTSLGFKTSV